MTKLRSILRPSKSESNAAIKIYSLLSLCGGGGGKDPDRVSSEDRNGFWLSQDAVLGGRRTECALLRILIRALCIRHEDEDDAS